MEKLGKCPVCGKGEIVEGTRGWNCNYFKAIDDKCLFNIYNQYFQREITKDDVLQLLDTGETDVFSDLETKDGNVFSASLVIENGFIKPSFKNESLNVECPKCGGKIEVGKNGYGCENTKAEEEKDRCDFYISKNICQVDVSKSLAETIIDKKETEFFDFVSKNDKSFTAKLILSADNNVEFNSTLCKCPKCEDGDIIAKPKFYGCSNYNSVENKCDFKIWREIAYRELKPKEAKRLCEKNSTGILKGFTGKKGEFDAKIILSEDYKTKFI